MIILFKFKIYWKLDLGKYQILYLTCWSRMQQVCVYVCIVGVRVCARARAQVHVRNTRRGKVFSKQLPEPHNIFYFFLFFLLLLRSTSHYNESSFL